MERQEFDFETFEKDVLAKLKAGEGLTGSSGAFTPLLKSFLEEVLKGELADHLENETSKNRKNGKSSKKLRTSLGELDLDTPRDRSGSFSPKIVSKRQKNLPNDIERQIFALYARGSLQ